MAHVARRTSASPRSWEFLCLAVVLSLGLATTFGAWSHQSHADIELLDSRFRADVERLDRALRSRFESATTSLVDLASLFSIRPDVAPEDFRRFVAPILDRHTFLRALSWNPVVLPGESTAFVAAERSSGNPGFEITEWSRGKIRGASAPEWRLVVRLIHPSRGNEAARGFDIYSEPTRREAVDRALASGSMSVTHPIALVQEPHRSDGALAILPVYRHRDSSGREAEESERKDLLGVVVAVLGTGEIARDAILHHDQSGVQVALVPTGGAPAIPVTEAVARPSVASPALEVATRFGWGGLDWQLVFRPSQPYLTANSPRSAPLVLATGLLATALLCLPLLAVLVRARGLRREVQLRRMTERTLRNSEERLSLVVAMTAEGIWDWDIESGDVYFSPGWRAGLGYLEEESPGRIEFWESIVHPDDMPAVREALDAHFHCQTDIYECRNRLRCADGTWRWNLDIGRVVERADDGRPLRMVGVDRDIGEHRLAEETAALLERQLREAQKIESLGSLARAVAHDFNNMLTVMLLSLESLREPQKSAEVRESALADIESAGSLAAELCRRLLTYSGSNAVVADRVDLNQLITDSVSLVGRWLGKSVNVNLDLSEDLPHISGDSVQLRQALINLVINAAEAYQGSAGRIDISSARILPTTEGLAKAYLAAGELAGRECVRIEIKDNGPGMTEETRARLFEPLYTTKPTGTGLGLSTTLGVVRAHAGALFLDSELDKGSIFGVVLPIEQES